MHIDIIRPLEFRLHEKEHVSITNFAILLGVFKDISRLLFVFLDWNYQFAMYSAIFILGMMLITVARCHDGMYDEKRQMTRFEAMNLYTGSSKILKYSNNKR